jgi:hypothetical protein
MLDGLGGALTTFLASSGAAGRANPSNPVYKALVAASERTDPNLYQSLFGIAPAAAGRTGRETCLGGEAEGRNRSEIGSA